MSWEWGSKINQHILKYTYRISLLISVIWFHWFKSTVMLPMSHHQCHAALSCWPASGHVDGFDRLFPDKSAAGERRPEWPGSWPAAGWARWSPPAHTHGSLQTGTDTALKITQQVWGTLTCLSELACCLFVSGQQLNKASNGLLLIKTHHRLYLRAYSGSLLLMLKTSWHMLKRD